MTDDRHAVVHRPYSEVFDGWSYLDLPPEQATSLVAKLMVAGAGFACTSEPWDGKRRIYFASETARRTVDEYVANPD